MGTKYFDRRNGSGADGYTKDSADYFDYESFGNSNYSPFYINPRTRTKYQGSSHPTSGARFSFWDIEAPVLTPLALSLIPHL